MPVFEGYLYTADGKQDVTYTTNAIANTNKVRGLAVVAEVLQLHPSNGTIPAGSFWSNGIRMTSDSKPCSTTTFPGAAKRMANGLLVNHDGEVVRSGAAVVHKIALKTPLGTVKVDADGAFVSV